jgi:uncharacterized protein YqeY
MSLKQQIDADLKTAMLAGDKVLTTTLRGLKASILNIEIADGKRETGLSDDEIIGILGKEFIQGGNAEKAAAESLEKQVIEKYLPAQMDDETLRNLVEAAITETGAISMQDMGKVIGIVKSRAGAAVDGGRVAQMVKEKLHA